MLSEVILVIDLLLCNCSYSKQDCRELLQNYHNARTPDSSATTMDDSKHPTLLMSFSATHQPEKRT